jgi:hypothetical protein
MMDCVIVYYPTTFVVHASSTPIPTTFCYERVSTACPRDVLHTNEYVCRTKLGECDLPEVRCLLWVFFVSDPRSVVQTCDGKSAICPTNEIVTNGTVCRPVVRVVVVEQWFKIDCCEALTLL